MMHKGSLERGGGYVDQIFTLKQIGEKTREKNSRMYVDFIHLENA